MPRKMSTAGAFLAAAAFSAALAPSAFAQTAPAAETATDSDDSDVVVLSPFVVSAADTNSGYAVKDTLAGTRIRTELKDVASSLVVVNKQFMNDIGATDNQTLLQYTGNTEVGGVGGNFLGTYPTASGSYGQNTNLLRPNANTRVRGLDSADNTRDYFMSDVPWDGYNVDRVDIQRGPNSILFGVGSPAGIINVSVNPAAFKNAYTVETKIDKWGSMRGSVDANYVLIDQTLALRVSALDDDQQFEQRPAFEHDKRVYAALAYQPKVFAGGHTSLRLNYEHGDIDANRPRSMPPEDRITQWFSEMGKASYDPSTESVNADVTDPNSTAYTYGSNPWICKDAMGRQYWPSTVAYYSSATGNDTPTYLVGMTNVDTKGYGLSSDGSVDGTVDGLAFSRMFAVSSWGDYYSKLSESESSYSYYTTRSLTDASVFNFYENLIDGDNKREWQNWDTGNLNLSQTFFGNRLGLELVYNKQRYREGQSGILLGGVYAISVDINTNLLDGSVNPNYGRAYIAGNSLNGGSDNRIDRDSARFTLFGELRATDLLKRSWLTDVLGRHVFTGLVSTDQKKTYSRQWASAWSEELADILGEANNLSSNVGAYNWVVYLSDSLADADSAAGASLSRIKTAVSAASSVPVTYFSTVWNATGVDPAAAYTYTDKNGNTITSTQSENPANYEGWTTTTVDYITDRDSLLTEANKTFNQTNSKAFTWQGYMFDECFVPVFGWRRDSITVRKGSDAEDDYGWVDGDGFTYNPSNTRTVADESLSWGGVLHLPAAIRKHLPWGTTASVFYNRSANFKVDEPRYNIFAEPINNPRGQTKEYGFALSTLHDKIGLKVNWYTTRVSGATLPYGTGFDYRAWYYPAWLICHAAVAEAVKEGVLTNGNWDYDSATATRDAALAAVSDCPLSQAFFDFYGKTFGEIDVSALRSGDLLSAWPLYASSNNCQANSIANCVGTADTVSKGIEFELTAQPLTGWNVALNVSKVKAVYESVSPDLIRYMDEITAWMNSDAGLLGMWWEGGTTFQSAWNNEVLPQYYTLLCYVGNSAPEVAPWKVNLITSYNFSTGFLKNVYVGGGYRWEDKKILGFGLTDDVVDSDKPLYGDTTDHYDFWIGYSRKLTERINWRIQLNLRNLGEKHHLEAASLEPDGSIALARIVEGMTWQLSNTFSF